MRMSHTSSGARTRRRLAAGAAAGTLLLAACGGGSDDSASGAQAGEPLPEVDAGATDDRATDAGATDAGATDAGATDDGATAGGAEGESAGAEPVQLTSGMVDLVGPEVQPSSNYEANLLPDVVVDELGGSGRKVNFRNLVPQEKPILLWMYAPH